jgi:hypothetical protein
MTESTKNEHNASAKEAVSSQGDDARRAGVAHAEQKETGDHMIKERVSETDARVKKRRRVNFGILLLLAYGIVLLFYIAKLSTDLMSRSASDQVPASSKSNIIQGTQRSEREPTGAQDALTVADRSSSQDDGIDVDTLRRLLEPHGWRVASDNEGGVLLFPRPAPTPAPATSSLSRSPPEEGHEPFDVDMLRSLLTPHGWRVESDGGGGVLLIPRGSKQWGPN